MSLMLAIVPLCLMLAAATTPAHAQTTSSPADWTQFHRDNMQRWNPYETTIGLSNVGSLQLKWKSSIGVFSSEIPSSPAVANGVVYSEAGDKLYALNASTGALLWSYVAYTTPAVANGVVYVGCSGGVCALNASTGAQLWSYTTGSLVTTSPAVVSGVVYISSWDDTVYALNASTGARLWSYTTGGSGSDELSDPAVANGVVYIGSDDNNVYALNASTGAKLWSFTTGARVRSSPAVANGMVYVGSGDGNLYALNASTGARLWSSNYGGNSRSSPAAANGVVYICSDPNLYAFSAVTGAELWSYNTGSPIDSSPAVANGVVYFGDWGGNVYALNASTGVKLWSYAMGRLFGVDGNPVPSRPSPTVVNGVLYVYGPDTLGNGNLYAFSIGADLFLRIQPTPTTVHQGDLLTYAFPVWNLGPLDADHEVLNTQVPAGTTFDYIRISGTPGLGTCKTPLYQGTGQIICHENASMAPNTTWTVRLTVKVTAPAGTVITESAATMADTPDPNLANNTATVSVKVQ